MFLEFEECGNTMEASQAYRGTLIVYSIEETDGEYLMEASLPDGEKLSSGAFDTLEEAIAAAERTAADVAFGEKDDELGDRIEIPMDLIEEVVIEGESSLFDEFAGDVASPEEDEAIDSLDDTVSFDAVAIDDAPGDGSNLEEDNGELSLEETAVLDAVGCVSAESDAGQGESE